MSDTVLVAGGAGYIGSHVCKALSRAGYSPVVYDNLVSGHLEAVRWGTLETGDLDDAGHLEAVLEKHRPVAVIHLAGFIAAGESVQNPAKYYGNNLRGMLTLLDAMRRCGVMRIVFSSSAAVYGAPDAIPIREDAPIHPENPYGHTKAMSEQILRDHAVHGIRSVSLRYFNAAGADPEGELGEMHEPETHLIPLVIEAAAGLRPRVDIYGDDYPTADGTCIRDYIHVSDLAEAHVAALRHTAGHEGADAFNLGNGRGFSVLEVIETVERVTGRRVPVQHCPPRPGDPSRLVADATRAMETLGWRQNYAELMTQVEHAWAWQLRQLRPSHATPATSVSHDRRKAAS